MLTLLFITTLIVFVFISKIKTGNMYNPLTFFLVFWCFWAVVSMTNPFQLFEVSTRTYVLVWLNVVFFSLGFILVSNRIKLINLDNIKLPGNEFIRSKKFLILQISICVVLLYYYLKYNKILSGLTSNDMRTVLFERGYMFDSTLEYLFYFWIIGSIINISIVIMISNIVMGGKKNITLFIVLVNCYLYGEIGNGRFIYFFIIIYFLVSIALKYFIHKKIKFNIKEKPRKSWALYLLIIISTVFVMNRTSAKRMGESLSLTDSVHVFFDTSLPQFTLYFIGPFRALDIFLTSKVPDITGYTFGRAFLGGIEELFSTFSIAVTGSYPVKIANQITSSFTGPPIMVGEHDSFNAFYTSVMNSYLDGGITFVIMLAFLYGIVSGFIYNYCLRNLNIFTFSLLVYTTYQMIASEFRWNYQSPLTWIVIFILVSCSYVYKRKSKKILVKNKIDNELQILSVQ